jgi:hypothetical protein
MNILDLGLSGPASSQHPPPAQVPPEISPAAAAVLGAEAPLAEARRPEPVEGRSPEPVEEPGPEGAEGHTILHPAPGARTIVPPRPGSALVVPKPPTSLAEAGLKGDATLELLLKTMIGGEVSGSGLSERLRLPYALIEPLVDHARAEKLIEVKGAAGAGTAGYKYALTDFGRVRAMLFLDVCRYIGPAPVPLAQYNAYIREAAAVRGYMDRERIGSGFGDLIVNDEMLEQLGPAANSNKSIFLYGPPGNGKTVLAEGLGRSLGGEMYVPHAIDVDGQIITMFDPVNHRPVAGSGPSSWLLAASTTHDRRWERIERPTVVVGGELTLDMLDLSFNGISKFYEASIQWKANGGVFVVDDFGRQRIPARDLLNRWIVPLESRVDYLTLHTGRKFEIPFDVLIIFATNLKPESLADEAFLRRIPYKIYAKNPSLDEFSRIFALNCRKRQLEYDPAFIEYLMKRYYQPRGLQMRACHPRDLIEQVMDLCRFQQRPPGITRELLDHACDNYFIDEQKNERASREGMTG